MNYTQEQLEAALRYANANAAQPNEVAILAAEVRRLQSQYEMDRLGMSDAMTAIDLRNAAISERDAIIAQLRDERDKLQSQVKLDERAKASMLREYYSIRDERDKLQAELANCRATCAELVVDSNAITLAETVRKLEAELAARDTKIAALVAAGDTLYALANAWAAHYSGEYNNGTVHLDHSRFLNEWEAAKSAIKPA